MTTTTTTDPTNESRSSSIQFTPSLLTSFTTIGRTDSIAVKVEVAVRDTHHFLLLGLPFRTRYSGDRLYGPRLEVDLQNRNRPCL